MPGFLFLFLNARCASYQFIPSLIMELGLINISPWSAGMPLSFSAEGEGRTIEEQGLLWSRFSRLLQRVVPSSLELSPPPSRLSPALRPCGACFLQHAGPEHTGFLPRSATGQSDFPVPVPAASDGQQQPTADACVSSGGCLTDCFLGTLSLPHGISPHP